jgi:antitoxin (DNA-binding transcriptional repressor) of toxin-antitoxin stability system
MEITATYLAQNMGKALQFVIAGHRVTITRYGNQVAELVPRHLCEDAPQSSITSTVLFQQLGHYLDRTVSGETFAVVRHNRVIACLRALPA